MIMIIICMDYFLIVGSIPEAIHLLKSELSDRFQMEGCGDVQICFGLEVVRGRSKRI